MIQRSRVHRIRYFVAFFLLTFLSVGMAFAQADRATVTGVVTDPTGAVLPGAAITATSTGTGATFTGITNDVGTYSITALPIGAYKIVVSRAGFKDTQAAVYLTAAQVEQFNVKMTVGNADQTVTVTAAPPLLEAQTSNVKMTLEDEAIRDLPLNSTNGRDAITLIVNTVPTMQGSSVTGNEVFSHFISNGTSARTNDAYVDGVMVNGGAQGTVATPGLDALQEMQVQTTSETAELGATGSSALLFEMKSGTNQFHGTAFDFTQNQILNANSWSDKYFLAGCGSTDTACINEYKNPVDRFNDWGASAGGPIWKDHTFVYGDYEYYSQSNYTLLVNAQTVPTSKMLAGDFSELLTGGTHAGNIINSATDTPYINPCTTLPYQYGQIFDPLTQQVVNGQTCATPFQGNIIPPGRISPLSQSIAAIYTKSYKPTLDRIYNNYPLISSNTPHITKRSFDLKMDHNFSSAHHVSASFNYVKWVSITGTAPNGGDLAADQGHSVTNPQPLSAEWSNNAPNYMARVIDNYAFSPNLLNTLAAGYNFNGYLQVPTFPTSDASAYGFNSGGKGFPYITYDSSNGVQEESDGTLVYAYQNYYGYTFQDSLTWQKKNHSFKFGGYMYLDGLDSNEGGNILQNNFQAKTGGPTDSALTPWVGSAFANMMLGDVQSASQAIPYPTYPRQKFLSLFAQDDIKVNNRLTANLGVSWDFTFAGKQQNGHLTNFDLTQQNPNWAPYYGAWTFAKNSSSTFETSNTFRQFGPHVGLAYKLTPKLLVRGSYGLYYVPLGLVTNTGFGTGSPLQQSEFWTGSNVVANNVPGSVAYQWDSGYPGQTITLPRTNTQTSLGYDQPFYTSPDTLHLGYVSDYYLGMQYEMAKDLILDVRYLGTRGNDLHDDAESVGINYPSFDTYAPLVIAGTENNTVSNAGQAAALGVPYPYPGFSGPAYAAIAPIPQTASYNNTVVLETDGQLGVSDFNAFIIEVKSMEAHGLNADLSYNLSHWTGSNLSRQNYANNGTDAYQSADDIPASRGFVESIDIRNVAEGYITYNLPLGTGQQWLSRSSKQLNAAVSGWTVGAFGSYSSGTPMPRITSPNQYPFFFSSQRDNFANGATPYNMKNHFKGKVDLANLSSVTNQDFNQALFSTPAVGKLGNSPYIYDKWRWNSGLAKENASLTKAFAFGGERRYQASIRAEFYNVFNRHYFGAPSTTPTSVNFGNVTTVSGNRTAQVAARFRW